MLIFLASGPVDGEKMAEQGCPPHCGGKYDELVLGERCYMYVQLASYTARRKPYAIGVTALLLARFMCGGCG